MNVRISGYTDNTGSDDYNMRLSERRAKSVMAIIMKEFPTPGLSYLTQGYGEQQPISDNNSEESRAKNRRVEIVFERN